MYAYLSLYLMEIFLCADFHFLRRRNISQFLQSSCFSGGLVDGSMFFFWTLIFGTHLFVERRKRLPRITGSPGLSY